MLHVIGCVTSMHDGRLVALACLLCGLASLTTLRLLGRAEATEGRARRFWIATGGLAFGSGVWVTHFVAMLAYTPGLPIAFDVRLTLLSLLWAIGGGWLALACGVASRLRAVAAGVAMGAAIGAMHFTGMSAFEVPGVLVYDRADLVSAWLAGLVLAPLALLRARQGHAQQATLLLVLAIAGLHFIAMAAVFIVPNGAAVQGLATGALAVAVAAVGLLVLLASLGGALLDQHLERRGQQEAARLRRFADATFEGLFFLDGDIVSDANYVICRMLRRPTGEIVGSRLADFVAPEGHRALASLRAGAELCAEVELLIADGSRLVVDMLARPGGDGSDPTMVVAVRDASERKRAERRIQELANTDPLTGLANRLLLAERLAGCLAGARLCGSSVAVLCLDLDRFKRINDVMGHPAGDSLLVEVGQRLRAATRDTDTVARPGGDEFVIVAPFSGSVEGTRAMAQRLVDVLAEPYRIDGTAVEISASIGIALCPADSCDAETLLRQADLALYRAKHDGRNVFRFFEPTMDIKLRARRAMEQDLHQALANGEFHLHYQPVRECDHLGVIGYEALLRWRHPRRGEVSPGEFIELAEDTGDISAIGAWVLQAACAEAAGWRNGLTISVNVSPVQLRGQDFAGQVASILERTGLAPCRLELEVTEGVLIGDPDRALAVLRSLKALGVRIALDDFGTGHSSLSYLHRFPFDRLKIDRSFISEIDTSADAKAIVRCILAMARSLHLEVTAEGVETDAQLHRLRAMRCGHAQGFLLGRPSATASPLQVREVVAA